MAQNAALQDPPQTTAAQPDLERMMANAKAASDFLKALAHENRLLLLCLLAERPRTVSELEEMLNLRQPTVSQQLARLRLDNLVTTRREGKSITYSIADENVRRVIGTLYDVFCASCEPDERR